MDRRAQVAVEFLTTYGWVIIGILLLFAVLFYYGTFDPMRFVPNQCEFEHGFHCETYRFQGVSSPASPMRLTVQFSNNLGYDIAFANNTVDIHTENVGNLGKNTYLGNCSPRLPDLIKKDTLITCTFDIYDKNYTPAPGKKVRFQVELNYTNCVTDPNYFINHSCTYGSNYTSSGVIVTPVEGNLSLSYGYCGDNECRYPVENRNNCPADCPPPTTIIVNVSPNLVTPDGNQYSIASAIVSNKNIPVRGIDVTFISTPIGNVSSYSATTDINGNASIHITSTVNGTADVSASSYGISNSTKLTFQSIPKLLQLSAYDPKFGTCSGSYIMARVLDSGGMPLRDVPVNFSLNVGPNIANVTPWLEVTDVTGYSIVYVNAATPGPITVTAKVDLNQYNVHLINTTIVTAVGCQLCDAPVQGDWVIDKKVSCENSTIILNGNLNISVDIAYMRKWGDLTFKNVTLIMNSSTGTPGERGIYLNRMARFTILDNDNNSATSNDASNITVGGTNQPFVFRIHPTADTFIMKNSNMTGAGCDTSSGGNVGLSQFTDYHSGLFISNNNSLIQNNTFSILASNLISIILNSSMNTTILNNTFRNVKTAVALINSFNNTLSNNSINLAPNGYTLVNPGNYHNPGLYLSNASNNTISYNYVNGNTASQVYYSGSAIVLTDASTDNNITKNYFTKCDYEVYLYLWSHRNKFSNNSIFDFQTMGVSVMNSYNNTFENNYLNNSAFASLIYQFYMTSSFGTNVTNNTLSTSYYAQNDDIYVAYSDNSIFANNDIYDVAGYRRMDVVSTSNITLTRMNIKSVSNPPMISLTSSPLANISSNNIDGLSLYDSGGSTIFGNSIRANTGSTATYGIKLTTSDSLVQLNIIGSGSCPSTMDRGIDLNISRVTITNNSIRNFIVAGIYINNNANPSMAGYITNNDIFNTSTSCAANYGIYSTNANAFGIDSNRITGGGSGIYFNYSEPVVSFNNITRTTAYGVYCNPSTISPVLWGNNITNTPNLVDSCQSGSESCNLVGPAGLTLSTQIYCEDNIQWSVAGDINITNGGRLTIKNTTVRISGGKQIWVKNGGRLVITDKDGLQSTNDASTLKAASGRFSIKVDPGGYLTIRNSVIQMAGNSSVGPGIQVNTDGSVIIGNNFSGGYRSIYLANSLYHQISNNIFLSDEDTPITLNNSGYVTINGNTVSSGAAPFRSIQMYGSSNNNIYQNSFANERDASIFMQGPSSNNSISQSNFDTNVPIHIELSANNNSIYRNNFVSSQSTDYKTALSITSANNTQFYNNTLNEITDISIQNSFKNGIHDNRFIATLAWDGITISVSSSANDSIYLNYFDNPSLSFRDGYVSLLDSTNESVYNNTMNGMLSELYSGPTGGIYLENTNKTTIQSNTIYDKYGNSWDAPAIRVIGGDDVYIILNNITRLGGIQASGNYNSWYTLENNTVVNSQSNHWVNSNYYCVYVAAYYPFIYGNIIANCTNAPSGTMYGLYLNPTFSSSNSVTQNNFTNNTVAVYCNSFYGAHKYFTFNNYTNNVQNCSSGCPNSPVICSGSN